MKVDKDVAWTEAWDALKVRDFTSQKALIIVEEPKSMMQKLFGCFSAGLEEKHKAERDIVYCLAKHEYSPDDNIHFGIIKGIHTFFTGHTTCPIYGLHWKKIGFQSEDPSRDFRATGVLGPLQISSLIQQHPQWAREIYELSIDEFQNFPLAVSQFGISRVCLEVFRTGKLNGFTNEKPSFVTGFDEFYFAVTVLFYQYYKSRHGTASQYGIIMQEVESKAKSRAVDLIKKYLAAKYQPNIDSIGEPLI